MNKNTTLWEVMTPAPHCIEAGAKLVDARAKMHRYSIRHLPVTDKGRPFGILSDRDIELACAMAVHVVAEDTILVREVCSKDPYIVPPSESLATAVRHMAEIRIGSTLVGENNKIIGIFTATDACRCLGQQLDSCP